MERRASETDFQRIGPEPFQVAGAILTAFPLQHPGGSFGLRIDCDGRSLACVTDHEPGKAAVDADLAEKITGCDLLLCDAQFTLAEWNTRRGWGHGTPEHAARLATQAQVKQLLLTHHDPLRTDADLKEMEQSAIKEFAESRLGRDGLLVVI